MTLFGKFDKTWLRPILFFGNNPIILLIFPVARGLRILS
jgi:hypothetical protein